MVTETLSPTPKQQFLDNNGNPADRYRLFTYAAGTTIKATTYTDSSGSTPNANPITLDFRGECNLWIPPNTSYKYVYCAPGSDDPPTTSIWTVDNVVNNQLITLYGGVDTGIADAYILNFTAQFSALTDGIVVYWVPSHNNTGASTINVNSLGIKNIVNLNGSALGANQIVANQITQIIYQAGQWQLLSVGNVTGVNVGTFGTETTIASAATTDLGSALAHVVNVTGTTTITSFGSSAQVVAPIYTVRFSGALTLTYNATSMILPGAADITAQAGDSLIAQYLGSGNWKVLIYQGADGYGTWTCTWVGFGVVPFNSTVTYVKNGNQVTLRLPLANGTSNSTQFAMTGLPAFLTPSVSQLIPLAGLVDNNASVTTAGICIVNTTNSLSFGKDCASLTTWTAALAKGFSNGLISAPTVTYMLK